MRSPHEQILDLVVKMDARGARKVRDMADAHLRDLDAGEPAVIQHLRRALCQRCGVDVDIHHLWGGKPPHAFVDEGVELQAGLEAAVILERERLDGPDDDGEEPAGQIGQTNDF